MRIAFFKSTVRKVDPKHHPNTRLYLTLLRLAGIDLEYIPCRVS